MAASPLPRPEIERRRGFTPVPNESLQDWPRLLSGNVQFFAVMYINSEIHVPRDKGAPVPRWTRPIPHAELAAVCRCTIRAVEIKLKDLMDRNVIEGKRTGGGFRYHIPFETWPSLPDFVAVVEMEAQPATVEEETEEQRAAKRQFRSEPQSLKAGQKSRPVELGGCAPDKASVRTKLPITYTIEVVNGVAIFDVLDGAQSKSEQQAKPNRNRGRFAKAEVPVPSTQSDFAAIHSLLDEYCIRHHGTVPNDKLLTKIHSALGKATMAQFKAVIQAKIRAGKPIPMALFINLAMDAAAVALRKPAARADGLTEDQLRELEEWSEKVAKKR